MDKVFKYKLVVFVIICFFLLLLPKGIYLQSQIQKISIVSGIGIDKTENGIEVSVQILVPQPSSSYSPKQKISSAEGENIPDAIGKIELKVGQELGLAHCYIIILGDEIFNEDVTKILDYLMRSNIMGNNSAILHTDKTAKEILETSSKLSEEDINNLQNLAKFNQEHYSSSNTNLIDLFNDYLSNHHCSVVGSITTQEENSTNQNSEKQENQDDSQQKSNSESKKILDNKGNAIIIKNGKKIASLKKEEIECFGWLDKKSQKGYVTIKNYSQEKLQNATITLKTKNEKVFFHPKIVNNIPVLEANISFEYMVESIENGNGEIISIHNNLLSNNFQNKVKNVIQQEVEKALNISKQYNFDIINAYNIFNNQNTKKWKEYLNSLENCEDYIQNFEITINLKIENKY